MFAKSSASWMFLLAMAALAAPLALGGSQPQAPSGSSPTVEAGAAESLDVQIARARLRVAEIALQKVERMNQRVKQAVPADVVAEYRRDEAVARQRLDDALKPVQQRRLASWLRIAEAAAETAEARYQSAVAANQRQANTLDDLDIQRLRARADLARLNLAEGRAVADHPPEIQLQWQVNLLEAEVQRLREEMSRGTPSGGIYYGYPRWW